MEGWFNIQNPAGRRKSFAIQRQWTESGRVRSRTVKNRDIKAINEQFHKGLLNFAEARAQIEQVQARLYKDRDRQKPVPLFTDENLKALNDYWKHEYLDRDISDPENMYRELKTAVGYLQGLSLFSASREELRDHLRSVLGSNVRRHRRIIARLNQLLKFLNRGFMLKKPKADIGEVTYLSRSDFEVFIREVDDPFERSLYWTAYMSGARLGECFAMRPENIDNDLIRINKQMLGKRKKYRESLPKRGKRRTAVLFDDAILPLVKEWAKIPIEEKQARRDLDWAGKVKSIAGKLFPDHPVKHITFHGLRHSYAINMLQSGVPLDAVALNLGNTRAVCEKYYTGFVIREPGIDMIRGILRVMKPA